MLHGMIGTVFGGVVGYGVATSGLAPVPFQTVALYTGVLAVICGGFGALAGRNLWRPRSRP